MMAAPTGTSAWRRLFSDISRPRDENIWAITSTMASSTMSATFMTSAIASRVMSS